MTGDQERCEVLEIQSNVDYRTLSLQHSPLKNCFLIPNDEVNNRELIKLFQSVALAPGEASGLERHVRSLVPT